jgi:hypothetical protein
MAADPAVEKRRRRRIGIAVAVPLAVVLAIVIWLSVALGAGFWPFQKAPCCDAGTACTAGHAPCPVPPPPPPSLVLTAGSKFTIAPTDYVSVPLSNLSSATLGRLEGSYASTGSATIFLMTTYVYPTFQNQTSRFGCEADNGSCFSTGPNSSGAVDWYFALGGPPAPIDWVLVQEDSNVAMSATVTWTTNLEVTYIDVYS